LRADTACNGHSILRWQVEPVACRCTVEQIPSIDD
jgi:hypothetical protein